MPMASTIPHTFLLQLVNTLSWIFQLFLRYYPQLRAKNVSRHFAGVAITKFRQPQGPVLLIKLSIGLSHVFPQNILLNEHTDLTYLIFVKFHVIFSL